MLFELLQYALNAAITRGVQRFFARVEDERPEIEIFGKLGFQRYARELTYWLESPADGLERLAEATRRATRADIERRRADAARGRASTRAAPSARRRT